MARKGQVGAAVRAIAVEQAPTASAVAEQHEVLSQQAQGLQRAIGHAHVEAWIEFVQQGHRLPVAAQQFAACVPGPIG
jgi:hypothetical protein